MPGLSQDNRNMDFGVLTDVAAICAVAQHVSVFVCLELSAIVNKPVK